MIWAFVCISIGSVLIGTSLGIIYSRHKEHLNFWDHIKNNRAVYLGLILTFLYSPPLLKYSIWTAMVNQVAHGEKVRLI